MIILKNGANQEELWDMDGQIAWGSLEPVCHVKIIQQAIALAS